MSAIAKTRLRWLSIVGLGLLAIARAAVAKEAPPPDPRGLVVTIERDRGGGVLVHADAVLPQPLAEIERTLLDCQGYPTWIPGILAIRSRSVDSACAVIEASL